MLWNAHHIVEVIQCDMMKREAKELTPAQLATHHAGRAANAAMWFAGHQEEVFKGPVRSRPYTTCAEAAAGAAFQGHLRIDNDRCTARRVRTTLSSRLGSNIGHFS